MAARRKDYRDLVLSIDAELNKIQDADLLLERILLEARRVVHADAGTIYVKEGDGLDFKYTQNSTLEARLPAGQKLPYAKLRIPIDESRIAGYSAKNMVVLRIDDAYAIPSSLPYSFSPSFDLANEYRTVSMLNVPLVTGAGNLLGVIQVLNAKDEAGTAVPFAKADEVLVQHFAASATVALERAYRTRAMILRMNRMAEMRDMKETGAHVNRVAGYAAEVYERWAVNKGVAEVPRERFKDALKMAAMMHDVGKVGISDLILNKPARFTPEEYRDMQAHTYIGALIFGESGSELDRLSVDVALRHHENWDGTGYPGLVDLSTIEPPEKAEGESAEAETKRHWRAKASQTGPDGLPRRLKGEDIPLGGRIVAIADVYDALVSKRVYKEPWDISKVYGQLREMSGSKFDPEVVDAFFEVLPRIEEIRSRYPDAD